jgi:hypothetical protein
MTHLNICNDEWQGRTMTHLNICYDEGNRRSTTNRVGTEHLYIPVGTNRCTIWIECTNWCTNWKVYQLAYHLAVSIGNHWIQMVHQLVHSRKRLRIGSGRCKYLKLLDTDGTPVSTLSSWYN